MAGQKPQVEQPEDRCRNVGDGPRHRLQQQPTADGGSREGQNSVGHISRQPALDRPLGGEQQQLAGHQGGFGGGANSLELRHPEELQQAKVHHSPQRGGEPPAPQAHDKQAKAPHTEATDQPLAQGCSGRWCLALIEDNLTDHADWRRPGFTLSIAVGRDLEA